LYLFSAPRINSKKNMVDYLNYSFVHF